MTFNKTIKKLAKLTGLEVRVDTASGRAWLAFKGYSITFFKNGAGSPDEVAAVCIHVNRIGDEARPEVDYFPGSYADTITQAVRWVNSWSTQDAALVAKV